MGFYGKEKDVVTKVKLVYPKEGSSLVVWKMGFQRVLIFAGSRKPWEWLWSLDEEGGDEWPLIFCCAGLGGRRQRRRLNRV